MAWDAASSCDASIVETCDGEPGNAGDLCEGESEVQTFSCTAVNANPACDGAGEGSYTKTVTINGEKVCCSCPDASCDEWQEPFETTKTCPNGLTLTCTTCLTVRDGRPTPTISSTPSHSQSQSNAHTKDTPPPTPTYQPPIPTITYPPNSNLYPTNKPTTSKVPSLFELLNNAIHPTLTFGTTSTKPKETPKPKRLSLPGIMHEAGKVTNLVVDGSLGPLKALGAAILKAKGINTATADLHTTMAAFVDNMTYAPAPNVGCAFAVSQCLKNSPANGLTHIAGSTLVKVLRAQLDAELAKGTINQRISTSDTAAVRAFIDSGKTGVIITVNHANDPPGTPHRGASHTGTITGSDIISNGSKAKVVKPNYNINSWKNGLGESYIYVPTKQVD